MLVQIYLLYFVFTNVLSVRVDKDEFEEFNLNSGNAPFFELPCMVVGGTCARSGACPKGTKLGVKGLCPAQQQHGIECCRPRSIELKCKSRGGDCVSSTKRCPKTLIIREATDCVKKQVCCAYVPKNN